MIYLYVFCKYNDLCDRRANDDEYNFIELLRQCNCSWRSILAIAPNIATVSRAAEGKGQRRERERRGGREEGEGAERVREIKGEVETGIYILYLSLKKINELLSQTIYNQ